VTAKTAIIGAWIGLASTAIFFAVLAQYDVLTATVWAPVWAAALLAIALVVTHRAAPVRRRVGFRRSTRAAFRSTVWMPLGLPFVGVAIPRSLWYWFRGVPENVLSDTEVEGWRRRRPWGQPQSN
jgi:hypothetical protein